MWWPRQYGSQFIAKTLKGYVVVERVSTMAAVSGLSLIARSQNVVDIDLYFS